MASEDSTGTSTFRPLNDNTIVVKIYSSLGEVAVGSYAKLHSQINDSLSRDLGCRYGIILYAQSGAGAASTVYLQYANNDLGPAESTDPVVLIQYYCPRTIGEDLLVLKNIHSTIKTSLDPNKSGLKIKYMIMNNIDMVSLDAPIDPAVVPPQGDYL